MPDETTISSRPHDGERCFRIQDNNTPCSSLRMTAVAAFSEHTHAAAFTVQRHPRTSSYSYKTAAVRGAYYLTVLCFLRAACSVIPCPLPVTPTFPSRPTGEAKIDPFFSDTAAMLPFVFFLAPFV